MPDLVKVLFRVTERCNLNCKYCFARDYSKNADSSWELLEKAVKFVEGAGHVIWIWHGSEPTMMGVEYYRKANKFLNDHGIKDISMQSNGVLFGTDAWLEYLKEGKMSVSISYDGMYQQEYRGHAEEVERAIDKMNANKITFGVISVIGEHNADSLVNLYDHMKKVGVKYWQFNTVFPSPRTGYLPETLAMEYKQSVYDLFITWALDKEPVRVRNFEEFIPYMLGNGHYLCMFSGDCFENFISITADGKVTVCDRWFDWFDGKLDDFGSVEELFNSEWRKALKEAKNKRVEECKAKGCPFVDICQGGCTVNSLEAGNVYAPVVEDCYERAAFISAVFEAMEELSFKDYKNPVALTLLAQNGFRPNYLLKGTGLCGI